MANNATLLGGKSYRDDKPLSLDEDSWMDEELRKKYPAGNLGMFVDLDECALEVKRDCNNLIRCRQKEMNEMTSLHEVRVLSRKNVLL